MAHWRSAIFNTKVVPQLLAFSTGDRKTHILKAKLPELIFPGKYKKCF